jgi:hypothetical protein
MTQNQIADSTIADPHRTQTIKRVLARLWEIVDLTHEMTRNSVTGQIKALSMIIALENLIPKGRSTAKPSPNPTQDKPAPAARTAAGMSPKSTPSRTSLLSNFNFLLTPKTAIDPRAVFAVNYYGLGHCG